MFDLLLSPFKVKAKYGRWLLMAIRLFIYLFMSAFIVIEYNDYNYDAMWVIISILTVLIGQDVFKKKLFLRFKGWRKTREAIDYTKL